MPSSNLSNEWHDGSELPGNMLKWIKVVQKIISSRGLGEILGVNLIQKVRNGIFCGNLLRLFRSGEIISCRGLGDILGVDLIQKVSNGIFLRKFAGKNSRTWFSSKTLLHNLLVLPKRRTELPTSKFLDDESIFRPKV